VKNTDESYVQIRLADTNCLSFNVEPGKRLTVKKYGPSSKSRPTVAGSKFKNDAYLVFNGPSKIGKIPPASLDKLGECDLTFCDVVEVNSEKNTIIVNFHIKQIDI
jgi:hypothetical protein